MDMESIPHSFGHSRPTEVEAVLGSKTICINPQWHQWFETFDTLLNMQIIQYCLMNLAILIVSTVKRV